MKTTISNHLQGKKILLLFIITNIIYTLMLTITIPKTMNFANGMKLLDMMPMGYSLEYVTQLFNALGEEGRNIYLFNQIPLDMIYPFLFGISYCLVFAYLLNKINKLYSSLFYISLLPIIAGIADYLENIGIIYSLTNFPNLSSNTIKLTSLFSIVKSTSTTIYFVSLLILLIVFGFQKAFK